jgi:hypothetical protein
MRTRFFELIRVSSLLVLGCGVASGGAFFDIFDNNGFSTFGGLTGGQVPGVISLTYPGLVSSDGATTLTVPSISFTFDVGGNPPPGPDVIGDLDFEIFAEAQLPADLSVGLEGDLTINDSTGFTTTSYMTIGSGFQTISATYPGFSATILDGSGNADTVTVSSFTVTLSTILGAPPAGANLLIDTSAATFPTPEPGTFWLLGLGAGLVVVGATRRGFAVGGRK